MKIARTPYPARSGSLTIGWLVLVLVMSSHLDAGEAHHVESAGHRCVGCIDGSCGTPLTPHGHYRGSWRRYPGNQDTQFPQATPARVTGEPVVPEPRDESRSRTRTRSNRPLKPDEMMNLDTVSSPMVPSDGGTANPFNNTVSEADLPPAGGGVGEAGAPDGGGFDPGGGFAPVPIEPDPATDENESTQDPLFNGILPSDGDDAGGSEPDTGTNIFDMGQIEPNLTPPNHQPISDPIVARRVIKTRGAQLLKGVELNSVSSIPATVSGPSFSMPVEDSVGGKFGEQSVSPASFLPSIESLAVASKPVPNEFPGLSEIPLDIPKPATELAPKPQVPILPDASSDEGNPLRRSPNLRRSYSNTASSADQILAKATPNIDALLEVETPITSAKPTPQKKSLSETATRRSVSMRDNPLRR